MDDDSGRHDPEPITVSGLTPVTMYGFQVQALGVLGYSDWSTTETIGCV